MRYEELKESQKQVLKAVKEAISNAGKELGKNEEHSNAKWTEVILTAICKKLPLRKYRYCCCSSAKKQAFGEWLFDLTYYEEDASRHLKRLLLVLESEWSASPYEIKYDFEKLLVAKCPLKVIITESSHASQVVEEGIKNFSSLSPEELYLLANHKGKGDFEFIVFYENHGDSSEQGIIQEILK